MGEEIFEQISGINGKAKIFANLWKLQQVNKKLNEPFKLSAKNDKLFIFIESDCPSCILKLKAINKHPHLKKNMI